jgi:hypothetical protein
MSDNWIKVEDALPEQGMDVLLLCRGDEITIGYMVTDDDNNNVFVDRQNNCDGSQNYLEVYYWQPLPKPPKV